MSWPEEPFEDLLSERIRNGIYKSAEHRGFGNPIVKMGELFANEVISDDAYDRVSLTDRDLRTATLAEGDLLFARRSYVLEGSGKCSIVGQLSEPTCFESSVIRARPDRARVVPRFLYYFFKSPYGRARMASIATRTAVSGIRGTDLAKLPVPCPNLQLQRRIASVLAAYDELIENNLRRIEILEEMAQAVYREWFVDLRFPGHEDVALVDSPLGPIPEGWQADRYGEIANEIKDGINPSDVNADVRYVGLEHIPQQSFTLTDCGSAADVASRKWRFRPGDVLFGKLRPYFHKVVEAGFEGICSTDAIVIRPGQGFQDLALQVAFSREFVAHAVSTSGGTDRPRAKWTDLADFDVVVPDTRTREEFARSVRPMVDLASNLARQNVNLRSTRDLLLPKLVSGEIDVSDLDIETEWLAS